MSVQLRRSVSVFWLLYFTLLVPAVSSCTATNPAPAPATTTPAMSPPEKAALNSIPVIHVFVALADNVNQGIVPVPQL
jgi:hypothetical protein